jgi:hypothetical protein
LKDGSSSILRMSNSLTLKVLATIAKMTTTTSNL